MNTKLVELKEEFLAMLNELDENNPLAIEQAPREWKDRLAILHKKLMETSV